MAMAKSQVQSKLSTNEKPQSIVPKSSRPISYRIKTRGWGGDRNPCFQTEPITITKLLNNLRFGSRVLNQLGAALPAPACLFNFSTDS